MNRGECKPPIFASVVFMRPLGQHQKGHLRSWRGIVQARDRQYQAFLKAVDDRAFFVELVAAIMGRALDLPIPEPIIARTPDDEVLFGSVALPHPDLRQPVFDIKLLSQQLIRWTPLHPAAAFDEWLANHDRNKGNILANGMGEFWLLDHELACGAALGPMDRVRNQLLDIVKARATDDLKKFQAVHKVESAGLEMTDKLVETAAAHAVEVAEDVVVFLETRSTGLRRLLRAALKDTGELL